MKKINFLFLSIATIMFFFSCKKEDTPTIVGKWNLVSNRSKIVATQGSTTIYNQDTTEYFSSGSYVDFRSNGTYTMNDNSSSEDGNYTVNNNKITIISSSDTTTLDILNLQSNSAQLYLKDYEDNSGIVTNYEFWINMTK